MLFAYSVLQIIIIDLVLSGDNAVVIGMAAHRLPHPQRKRAILIGGAAAIVLRIVLTTIAALLLLIPGLQIVGGGLLIWIAFRLLKQEQEGHEGLKVAVTLKEAVVTILIADAVMSVDNVVAVAGASHGEVVLLMFGLVLSMAILMWMGSIIANLINRFVWLSYVGAAVIAWTGALMIFEDRIIVERAAWLTRSVAYISAATITVVVTAFAHWFHRGRNAAQD